MSEEALDNNDVLDDIDFDDEKSDAELQAIEMGWNPEGVEGKRHKSPEEFIENKEMYDRIHKMERALKSKERQVEEISNNFKTIRAAAIEEAILKLKAEKIEALDDDDTAKVVEIDERLAEKREEARKEDTVNTQEDRQQANQDAFNSWVTKPENQWYKDDVILRGAANSLGDEYLNNNPDVHFEEVFEYVSKEMKKAFPEKLGNKKRTRAAAVEANGTSEGKSGKSKSKYSKNDLPAEDRAFMEQMVSRKQITEEEYLKSYFTA